MGTTLKKAHNIFIWHDVNSNSLNAHASNNYKPMSTGDLLLVLSGYKDRIKAIVYARRFGAPNIYDELKGTGILI